MQYSATPRRERGVSFTLGSTAIDATCARRRSVVRKSFKDEIGTRDHCQYALATPCKIQPQVHDWRWHESDKRVQDKKSALTPDTKFGSPEGSTLNNSEHRSQSRHTEVVSQFHETANRLVLFSLPANADFRGPYVPTPDNLPRNAKSALLTPSNFSRKLRRGRANPSTNREEVERDITSARRNFRPVVLNQGWFSVAARMPVLERRYSEALASPTLQLRLSNTNATPTKCKVARLQNFSRPRRPPVSESSPSRSTNNAIQIIVDAEPRISSKPHSQPADRAREKFLEDACQPNLPTPPSSPTSHAAHEFTRNMHATSALSNGSNQEETDMSQEQDEASIRHSFDQAVNEELGDERAQLKAWEIWLQRIVFCLLIFGINIALGLAYLGSYKHPYLLAILVFMKSKDILSTLADILGMAHKYLRHLIWTPRDPDPRWILSLVCAYAETEEQIMKTVNSLSFSKTKPHKQVICIILDGKPRDVLRKITNIKRTIQRPYTTWRGARGEIVVNAGYIGEVPIILIEKVKNAGKKDSLILGHDLFNYPRKNMRQATKLLRQEIWSSVIPSVVTQEELSSFGFVFCTDADSTIHEYALKRLGDALCKERNAIAACGILLAELGNAWTEYSLWHLFQQFQYTFGQYVRRQAESTWGRVTCLPGCITMIVVRPEMGDALEEYSRAVSDHNLFRHQVQYLGTDRRFTWSMLTQGKHLRAIFVPEALSETVVPDSLYHYLSQRRRWASNAYFNDYFYALGPQQRLITRLFATIDLVRITLVFYRVFNTVYFLHGLITNFYVVKIIPTLIVTKTPATWYLVLVLFKEPLLRKRMHKIILGMCINQIISPILSVIVFTNVLFHMGSQTWGKTGVSTQKATTKATPILHTKSQPAQPWTPRRLANTVRTAIRGVTPGPKHNRSVATPVSAAKSGAAHTAKLALTPRGSSTSPSFDTVSHRGSSVVVTSSSDVTMSGASRMTPISCTPVGTHGQGSFTIPMTLLRRTPQRGRRAMSKVAPVSETPSKSSLRASATVFGPKE